MNENSFPFSAKPEVLLSLSVDEALQECEKRECLSYGQVFFEKANYAEEKGEVEVAKAWNLLGHLCCVTLQASTPHEPFHPMRQDAAGQSMVPRDMDEGIAVAIHQLALSIGDSELRSRLFDAAWDRLSNHGAAREAVRSYMLSARHLFDPTRWSAFTMRIERALRLGRQLGNMELVEEILRDIENKIIKLNGSGPLRMTCRLMDLLYEFRHGEPGMMRDIAAKGAKLAEKKGDFERARNYHEHVARWCRRDEDAQGERAANIAVAESLCRQGESCSSPGQELMAVHYLEQAHEAYRNIPEMRNKTDEVYALLREKQRQTVNLLGQFRTECPEASELIRYAREHVAGKSFRGGMLALATVLKPTDFDQESKVARELMEKYPLQGLFGGMTIDRFGRNVAHHTPAFTADEKQFEQALWERVVQQVNMNYQLQVSTGIVPAIHQLNFEHSPCIGDMNDLVVNNPMVPSGHEELFARGFLAGLRWNFAESLSILVPQFENSLRHVLMQGGHEMVTRDKHGLQNFVQMGRILSEWRAELENALGADSIKEIKSLFTDQHSPDLRNRIAHGLMDHEDFFHPSAIYAWWFILHLLICPVRRRFEEDNGSAHGSVKR